MRKLMPLLLLFCSCVTLAADELDARFKKGVLIVQASELACFRFDIYFATDDAQRARGLMFVHEMPATTGMLFIYETDQYLSMWMKNTPLPLDMLFIDDAGTIVGIAEDTTPFSENVIASPGPVRYVLELNAGTAGRKGISVGDRARHHAIRQ